MACRHRYCYERFVCGCASAAQFLLQRSLISCALRSYFSLLNGNIC